MDNTRYGIEVLHWAGMKDECLPYLEDILIDNPQFVNFENKYGENALHIATRVNNVEIVKWLIEKTNIDYKKVIDVGNILLIAIESNSLKIANYLIDETDIDLKVVTKDGKNIFHLLMRRGNETLLEKLLAKYPEGINVLDNDNQHCLFDFITYFSQHKNYYLFDLLQERIESNIFKVVNKKQQNLLDFTYSIIENSDSKIEKMLKEELFSPLLSQLQFYLANTIE